MISTVARSKQKSGSSASLWAFCFGLLAVAGTTWLWAVSFLDDYNPADWIRIAGSQVWWIGILGAVIFWFRGRKGSKATLAHFGLFLGFAASVGVFAMLATGY